MTVSLSSRRTLCRAPGCRAPIAWVHTAGGRRMPLDANPSPAGNIQLTEEGGRIRGRVLTRHEIELAQINQTPLYTSHFATCPDAHLYRRRRT